MLASVCPLSSQRTMLVHVFCLLFLNVNTKSNVVNCDIFSSTSNLESLMYLERHMIGAMSEYIGTMDLYLAEIKNYIDEFVQTAGRPEFQGSYATEEIIGNPLQAFQLVKRLTVNWNSLKELTSNNVWKQVEKLEEEYQSLMPKEDDLRGAALALVRLQDTYNLNVTELANGHIKGYNSHIEMTARDCQFLGEHALNNGYYGLAVEWFQEGLIRAHREGNTTASVDELQAYYDAALKVHDDVRSSYWTNYTKEEKNPPSKIRYVDGDNEDYRNYQTLCRGEGIKRNHTLEKDLKCYLTDKGHPWLKLQPVKLEEYHRDPYIAMYYDLLTDSESTKIKATAAPLLERARVQNDANEESTVSEVRTSQTAWLSTDDDEIVERISRRLDAVTGLSTDMSQSHAELMQIANYGIGGHYTPHFDYLIVDAPEELRHLAPERDRLAGDRTATLMFYLSDVKEGGGTAFPRLGVTLQPRKNAAAFWYNLRRNGEGIIETIHGACPVLMGEKWVSNHWIREIGQALRRPCSLNPEE